MKRTTGTKDISMMEMVKSWERERFDFMILYGFDEFKMK